LTWGSFRSIWSSISGNQHSLSRIWWGWALQEAFFGSTLELASWGWGSHMNTSIASWLIRVHSPPYWIVELEPSFFLLHNAEFVFELNLWHRLSDQVSSWILVSGWKSREICCELVLSFTPVHASLFHKISTSSLNLVDISSSLNSERESMVWLSTVNNKVVTLESIGNFSIITWESCNTISHLISFSNWWWHTWTVDLWWKSDSFLIGIIGNKSCFDLVTWKNDHLGVQTLKSNFGINFWL